MKPLAAALAIPLFLLTLVPPLPAPAADSMEQVERELSEVLRELDEIRSEVERIEEFLAFPKATGIRIELHREGDVAAPARGRVLVRGIVEDEREWTRGEREAFQGPGSLAIAWQVPLLPGSFPAKVELFHPAWRTPPSVEIPLTLARGEVVTVKLRLYQPKGGAAPALAPAGRK